MDEQVFLLSKQTHSQRALGPQNVTYVYLSREDVNSRRRTDNFERSYYPQSRDPPRTNDIPE